MMEVIPLEAVPNQAFTYTNDNEQFTVTLKTVRNGTIVTIYRGSVPVIQGFRVVPFEPLIPYRYLEGDAGNFAFTTPNDEYPYYTAFSVTHILIYATAAELAAAREAAQ